MLTKKDKGAKMLVNVRVDSDTLLEMLWDRINFWCGENRYDDEDAELFYKMYERYMESGLFEQVEFDVKVIVDNDMINFCSVLRQEELSDEDWERLNALYEAGDCDVSCESFDYGCISLIEAMGSDRVLIRH